jgi:hypothetical protein
MTPRTVRQMGRSGRDRAWDSCGHLGISLGLSVTGGLYPNDGFACRGGP